MDSSLPSLLDSKQLRAFLVLAHTGSFTGAAKQLGLSQSAVSHSMKALERDMGCRLLIRESKSVQLTQAGEQLLVYAERILREMGEARSALEQLSHWGQSRLRLAATAAACQYILPSILRRFQESYPRCRLAIEPGDTETVVDLVRQHQVDLAITLKPRSEDGLGFIPIFTDELRFLVAASHPWARSGHVPREEIPRQKYVLYNKNSVTFRLIEQYFRQDDITLNTVIELGNMEAIKELVKLGLGVGILTPWIARQEVEEKTLVSLPLGRRKLKREWGVLHLRHRPLGLVEETFLNLCRRTGEFIAFEPGWPQSA